MTKLFTTITGIQSYLRDRTAVGLVPTMGALHGGHLSLIQRAKQENACVVVSIFVNPLQFGPHEDLAKYPRTLEADLELCQSVGVDAVFAPAVEEILGTATEQGLPSPQVVPPEAMTATLCGLSRPGHFTGVATIVTKLLHIVQPQKVYFGQKDGQQLAILKHMVETLNFPVQVIDCPTVREPNGLALSSRNRYLTPQELDIAAQLYRSLEIATTAFKQGETEKAKDLTQLVRSHLAKTPEIALEYVELVNARTLQPVEHLALSSNAAMLAIAARIGTTRLIDNVILRHRQPIIAIDGPAGAGKSTVAKLVAEKLNFLYLDTGAMYRTVTWAVLQANLDFNDEPAIAELASKTQIQLSPSATPGEPLQVYANSQNITREIRSPEVTAGVSAIAAHPSVRELLVKQQQELGRQGGVVMEGRDIGTTVFPDAEIKVFLTASIHERALRRQKDLLDQGQSEIDLEALEKSIGDRDYKDSNRAVSPLRQAADAIAINTDGLTIPEVVERIVALK